MQRLGYAVKLRIGQVFQGIVLSSETDTLISPADRSIVEKYGIAGINCSWNRLVEIPFDVLGKGRNQRLLPILYAANTVNYGKISKLNTAEAIAASLYITGYKEEALAILEPFSYGLEFIRLNEHALELYCTCKDTYEIDTMQESFKRDMKDYEYEKEVKKDSRKTNGGELLTGNYLDESDLPPMCDDDNSNSYDDYDYDRESNDDKINSDDNNDENVSDDDQITDGAVK